MTPFLSGLYTGLFIGFFCGLIVAAVVRVWGNYRDYKFWRDGK